MGLNPKYVNLLQQGRNHLIFYKNTSIGLFCGKLLKGGKANCEHTLRWDVV